jgi:xanthine dehydrogenase YagS FAD-binding subunit
MQPFLYRRPQTALAAVEEASRTSSRGPATVSTAGQFIAGGTNMSDYMKLNVIRPELVIDINHLSPSEYGRIESSDAGLRIGCLVRMSEAEDHPDIRSQYPVMFDALKLAASRQIRNMASLGGNVLQRTRCEYFREVSWPCNKRNPGSGCSAIGGANRAHAVLGTSEQCIAAYPGDFAQALIALGATVETLGPSGRRTIPFSDLHREPGGQPHIETVLEPGELIAFYNVPAGPWTRRSRYVKVRDRDSYQFALASAAVALDLDGDTVRTARIALGGVASVPWRAYESEEALTGKPLTEENAARAAEIAFKNAVTQEHNAFKVPLGRQTIVRALLEAKAMRV